MGARRPATLLWLGAGGSFVLSAWLFLPREPGHARVRPRLRVALVDVSASAARARAWLPWVRAELRLAADEARRAGEELAVLAFADGVATGFSPGDPARFLAWLDGRSGPPFDPSLGLGRAATSLADGLVAAEALLGERDRPPGELRLLGPCTYTGVSPAAPLARLVAAGVSLVPRLPPLAEASDLGLRELVLAPRVEAGAELVALLRFVWRRGTTNAGKAALELEVECDGSVRTLAQELLLPAQDGEFELPLACGPAGFGRNEVRARCRLASGPDLMPENDQARSSSTAKGARSLIVAVEPEQRAAAEAWLAPSGRAALAGLQFRFQEPDELRLDPAEDDALVTFDLAPSALPAPLVESFVRRGGGWLALSGFAFLGEWIPGAANGPLQRLLPCEPAQGEAAPRDVVLLVDGSGSMEGEAFESVRAAALELVSAALPSDRVSLRFFTVRLEPEHLLKPRASSRIEDQDALRRVARELLALRVPAGMTCLLSSLRELTATLAQHETLVLLLSDGWERDAIRDPLGQAQTVLAELQRARARLVVIAGGEPNLPLLSALAGGEERIRAGRTLADLRTLFERELRGNQLAEGELELRLAPRAPGSLADEVLSAAGASVPPGPVERYVRNRLRPRAEALWESSQGEPVLALARASLGRTALFASRPGAGWARRALHAGAGEAAEFEGVLRWLARGPERGPAPKARLEQRRLAVTGLAPGTPAELRVRLIELGGEAVKDLTLYPPSGLGQDVFGTRAAWLGRDVPGGTLLLIPPTGDQGSSAESELALRVESALPQEFARSEDSVPAAWLASPGRETRSATPARRSQRLAPWALALALALLLAAGLASGRDQGVRGFDR